MARKNLKWGSIQFEWNKSHAKIITDKGFGPELNKAFAKLIAKYSYDYVPYSFPENNNYEGQKLHLADMYYIRDYGTYATIVYTKPYAGIQYNGDFNHINQMHPKATKRWAEVAWQQNKQAIINALRKENRRLSNP